MAFYSRIRCASCRGIFDVYQEQMGSRAALKCPFCGTTIPEQQWSRLVECFNSVVDFNKEAVKLAAEQGTPLFTAEIRRHFVNRQRSEG